jgi:hypothetical protein
VPRAISIHDVLLLLLLAFAALVVHGYHLGVEDQAIYLPAVKKNLDPQLYPHDSEFFLSQTRWTIFDEAVAFSVRVTRLPLEWAVFLWHVSGIFLFLLGCLRVGRRCFAGPAAQWAGVALVAAVLTIPVAGTLALMADQYLHPRIYATAFALFALSAILDRRPFALAWIALGAVVHPQVTFFAVAHLVFQAWRAPLPQSFASIAAAVPPVTLLQNDAWREVMLTRRHHFPLRWTWYQWLGAYAPVILLVWFARVARRAGNAALARVSARLALSCTLGIVCAVTMNMVPALQRFMPTQPMRQLHFIYVLLFLLGGGLLGQYLLKSRAWRWALLLIPVVAGMFLAQRAVFSHGPHLEWPRLRPQNEWLAAFEWIRRNTPKDALFVLDPRYMERGADHHGFRGLAERSMLADYTKDRGVAAIFPSIAERWKREVDDRANWSNFAREDFLRLREKYGVTWVVLNGRQSSDVAPDPGQPCPYIAPDNSLRVCRLE